MSKPSRKHIVAEADLASGEALICKGEEHGKLPQILGYGYFRDNAKEHGNYNLGCGF